MKNRKVKITIGDMEYSGVWGESHPRELESKVVMKIDGIPDSEKVNVIELDGIKFTKDGD